MDGIKCFGFGKLLKQLFIISLISCFGLLANSFVKAEWRFYDVNEEFSVANATEFSNKVLSSSAGILQGGGMSVKPLIMAQGYLSSTYKNRYRTLFYRDTNNELNFLCNKSYSNNSGLYNLALYKFTDFVRFSGTGFQNYNPSMNGMTRNGETITVNSFYNNSQLKGAMTRFAYGFNNGNENLSVTLTNVICFIYDDLGFSICAVGYCSNSTSYGDLFDEISRPSGATIDPVEFDINLIGTSPWTTSTPTPTPGGQVWTPGTGSRLNGRLVVNSGYTNSDMIKGFECVGLQPSLCYGGFDIDNIFNPSEQFEDFTGYRAGQGATIFEIYNLYSGNFTSLQQFLNTVLTRYQNGQINSFKTEPKALLMLGVQMNTAGFKTSYIANYCNLLLNENNNNIYTGNSVDDLRVQSCIRSQKIGDSLREGVQDIGFQTTSGGVFSGGDIDFDPDTFFSNIMDTIDRNLNQNLSGGAVGLLPGYIVIAFLGLVFIRLITH